MFLPLQFFPRLLRIPHNGHTFSKKWASKTIPRLSPMIWPSLFSSSSPLITTMLNISSNIPKSIISNKKQLHQLQIPHNIKNNFTPEPKSSNPSSTHFQSHYGMARHTSVEPTIDQKKDYIIHKLVQRVNVLESSRYDDDQNVDDDTVNYINQPHVLTALAVVVAYFLYFAWYSDTSSVSSMVTNTKTGILASSFFVIILGMLTFPTSGPFSRPLPILWRSVFAIGLIYEVFLLIILFQNKSDARWIISLLDPTAGTQITERSYAENCELNLKNITDLIFDRFALAHFVGWFCKSFVIRDPLLCWVISIGWELIEILFTPLLPNFAECWYDSWLLDVLICNGLGITLGWWVQNHFKMMHYNWSFVYTHPIYTEKSKQLLSAVGLGDILNIETHDETDPETGTIATAKWGFWRSIKRFFGIQFIVLIAQQTELNAFFLKALLYIPPESYLNPARLFLWSLFAIPCVRQLYLYMTNPQVKTLGRQAWLSIVIMITEVMIIVKFSDGEYLVDQAYPDHLKLLIAVMVIMYIIFCTYTIIKIYRQHPTQDVHYKVASAIDQRVHADGELIFDSMKKAKPFNKMNVFDVMDTNVGAGSNVPQAAVDKIYRDLERFVEEQAISKNSPSTSTYVSLQQSPGKAKKAKRSNDLDQTCRNKKNNYDLYDDSDYHPPQPRTKPVQSRELYHNQHHTHRGIHEHADNTSQHNPAFDLFSKTDTMIQFTHNPNLSRENTTTIKSSTFPITSVVHNKDQMSDKNMVGHVLNSARKKRLSSLSRNSSNLDEPVSGVVDLETSEHRKYRAYLKQQKLVEKQNNQDSQSDSMESPTVSSPALSVKRQPIRKQTPVHSETDESDFNVDEIPVPRSRSQSVRRRK